jgi:hypothetical protein
MLARQASFRRAAKVVAAELATVPEVRAITLFGSVARALEREVPRFQPFRHHRIEVLHECRDIDLAVWIDRFDRLAALNRMRSRAVANLFRDAGIGVAHHQVEIFLFGQGWHDYRGRLCTFGQCPKGKVDCLTPGCGHELFLKQHADFVLAPGALAAGIPLYERAGRADRSEVDAMRPDQPGRTSDIASAE